MTRVASLVSLFCIVALVFPRLAYGQIDSIPSPLNSDQLEDFLQNATENSSEDEETGFDFNLLEALEAYAKSPLNLNTASRQELQDMGILSAFLIENLLQYREDVGELISIYELQAVPGFEPEFIKQMLPYVAIDGGLDDYNVGLGEMLSSGKNELFMRWQRTLEPSRGFVDAADTTYNSRFLGDPNKYYTRFRHSYENRLQYGFTAEKDAGEEFFTGSNKQGFDFYSAHIYLKDYNERIKAVAIGDYNISFGQGLVLFSGFGYGKSSQVIDIKKSSRVLRPYTSVLEQNFMRGAAATIGITQNLEITAFGSSLRVDGNIGVEQNEFNEPLVTLSSLLQTGQHRSPNEIEDEKALGISTVGGNLRWEKGRFQVALNAIYNKLDQTLLRNPTSFNQYYFEGNSLFNTLNGLLVGLDRKVDFSILHRHYPRDYQTLLGNGFGETANVRNEEGLYLGLKIKPAKQWIWQGYFDIWRHPWLRSTADAPSNGYEWRTRLTYWKKRTYTAYVELRSETKLRNTINNETKTDFLTSTRLTSARLHFQYDVSKTVSLRTRLNYALFDNGVDELTSGFLIYQDINWKPKDLPISLTSRFALFDTDNYNLRFYAYENDLLYAFSVPAYFGKGSRAYINVRYRAGRNLTLEGRIARSFYTDRDVISSGPNEIQGRTKTDVKFQARLKF